MGIEDVGMLDGNIQEGQKAVSEEEQARVREDMKKAAQARSQIAQAAAHNKQYAQLLSVLLQHISDEELLGNIFHQLIVYKIEPTAIFAQFIPLLKGKTDLEPYRAMFESIRDIAMHEGQTAEALTTYMNMLRDGNEEIRKVPEEEYEKMIRRIAIVGGYAQEEDSKKDNE